MEGLVLAGVLDYLFYMELIAYPLLCLLIPLYLKARMRERQKERTRRELRDFRVVLDSLSVSLKAGYSVERAIPEAGQSLEQILGAKNEMTRKWQRMSQRLTLKLPADQLLMEFAGHCDAEEIHSFAEVFASGKRLGGNLGRMAGETAEAISRKIEVEEEIQTVLASKKLEQKVMSVMPLLIILYMRLTSPGYLDVLYHSLFGAGVMTVFLIVWLLMFWWGREIVAIEV